MSRIIDLTMPIYDGMPAYPGEPTARFEEFSTIDRDGVAMTCVSLFSQIGTHVDAPCHFTRNGRTVDALDLQRLVGPAKLLRLGTLPPGSEITADLLRQQRLRLGEEGATRVIVSTGWSKRVTTPSYFADWPVLTDDAIDYLLESGVEPLGLDTPSPGNKKTNPSLHRKLFAKDVALVECLTNVEQLPLGFVFICLPLPLVGLDGSPVRALALVNANDALPGS